MFSISDLAWAMTCCDIDSRGGVCATSMLLLRNDKDGSAMLAILPWAQRWRLDL